MIDFLNLDDDIINIIINIWIDNLILEIYNLYKKLTKLEVLLKPLSIDKDLHTCKYNNIWFNNMYTISYGPVYYCMTNFLYSRLNEKIILINNYNIDNGEIFSVYCQSKILINPTYFEIFVEFNKSLKSYHLQDVYNIYLEGLQEIDKQKLNKFYRIRCKKDVTYYKFVTGI